MIFPGCIFFENKIFAIYSFVNLVSCFMSYDILCGRFMWEKVKSLRLIKAILKCENWPLHFFLNLFYCIELRDQGQVIKL